MSVHLKIKKGKKGRGKKRVSLGGVKVRERTQDVAEDGHKIQGRDASDIEWAVYKGLRSLGWTDDDVSFQVPIHGGRNPVGGGQVLDFVVIIGPNRVIIDVRGRQFHGPTAGKSARDRWREIQVTADPDAAKYVVVWEEVAHNWGRLRSHLLKEVGAK